MKDNTAKILQDTLSAAGNNQEENSYDHQRAPKLQASLESRDARLLMVKALEIAMPVLSAPIYVGVATCLNTRLSQHVNDINKLSSAVNDDPEVRQRLREKGKSNFAQRAVAAGFTPESLQVWTCNLDLLIEDLESQSHDARAVAEAVEWLLNRWHRPYLGRR